MPVLAVSLGLLWALVIVLSVLVVLLYRQFGLIYIGSRERVEQTGLPVGRSPRDSIPLEVEEQPVLWSWRVEDGLRGTVALMTTTNCQICAELLPELNRVSDKWSDAFRFLVVDRVTGDAASPRVYRELPDPRSWLYARDLEGAAHDALDVEATPHVFVLDRTGKVLAKGLVNFPEGIDSKIQAALGADGPRPASHANKTG